MCETLVHRGPDDEGYFIHENMGVGIRRLSVIDIAQGHQPLPNEDNSVWVIHNGEIYNFEELRAQLLSRGHRFRTLSDAEVIVHLYEEKQEDCLEYLEGMFAFAVVDTKRRKFFVARDRLGIKPLYYAAFNGSVVFASELKALMCAPGFRREIDRQSLYHFFSLNYTPSPETILKNVNQLPAGAFFTISAGQGLRVRHYWDLKVPEYTRDTEQEIEEKIRYLLKQAVSRMRKSDVPWGAFLSGGIDSSTLVYFLSQISPGRLKTFSLGFNEASYDETAFATLAAQEFASDHYALQCHASDLMRIFPQAVWHADNLLADPAMIPLYLLSAYAKTQVTVCFSGDGGDELFMGYPTYRADRYLKWYRLLPSWARSRIVKKLVASMPSSTDKLSLEYKAKKFVEGADLSPARAHYWWRTVFTDREKENLFTNDFLREVKEKDSYQVYSRCYKRQAGEMSAMDQYLYADLKVWLPDNNLVRVDAMSMAHGLEVRVPFLDRELVEYVASIPPALRMKRGILKYLLKKSMRKRLPSSIIKRKKAGWHVPLGGWFQHELKDLVTQTLLSSDTGTEGIFNKRFIQGVLDDHCAKRRTNTFKIWGLLVFFQWHKTFFRDTA